MTGTQTPSLSLYFVGDNPSVDANRDLFVWANTAEEAEDHWQKNYETTDRPDALFLVPTDNPTPGPVPWNIIRTELLT